MDNITNIIYNIKAIDNASSVIQNVMANLAALKSLTPVTIKIKTVNETQNKVTNTVKDIHKLQQSVSLKLSRTLEDTYKQTATYTTNIRNNVRNTNTDLNRTVDSTRKTANNARNANGWFGRWRSNIAQAVKRFLSFRIIARYLADCLNESASLVETLHLMEVSFEGASEDAYNFGKTISSSFGTSINEVYKYLAVFRQMTDAIGIADNTATKMSKSLTALGYDIASLYNISIQSAMEKLEAGIAGQTKPLRTLGMDITAQSLDNYLKQTLNLSNITSKQMTQADKMILRTIVIMEQAQNASGDMAETINTFANQVKTLQGSLSNFKLAVGDLIQAYFKPLVTYAAGFLIAITKIIRAFVPMTDTSGVDNLANSLSGVDDELNEIAETAGLLSFDKFNALSKNGISSDGSNITDLLTGVFDEKYMQYMADFEKAMQSVENEANKVAQSFISWVFPDAVFDDMGNVVTSLDGINNGLGRVNEILVLIWETIKIIVSVAIISKLTKLITLIQTAALQMKLFSMEMRTAGTAVHSFKAALEAMSGVIGFLFIYTLITLIEKWDSLSTTMKVLGTIFVTFLGILWLYSSGMGVALLQTVKFAVVGVAKAIASLNTLTANMIATHLPVLLKFCSTVGGMTVAITALVAAFAYYISSMDKMSTTAKILIPIIAALAAVFVGLAVAKAAAAAGIGAPVMAGITAAALTAAIVIAAGTALAVGTYAEGGFPEHGQLFIANEAGAELVGNIGGNTAVANNDMIVQAIENAAYRGFIRAIDDTQTASSHSGSVVLNINGKEFARATATDMANEFSRRNIKIK